MDELFIGNKYATCHEVKDLDSDIDPGIRAYKSSPSALTLQVRTFAGIGAMGRGVRRNMVASSALSLNEAIRLRDQLNAFIGLQYCEDALTEEKSSAWLAEVGAAVRANPG